MPSIMNSKQVLPIIIGQDDADYKDKDSSNNGRNSYTNNVGQHHGVNSETNDNANNADTCYNTYGCSYNTGMESNKAYMHRYHDGINNARNPSLILNGSNGASNDKDSWDNKCKW